MEWEARTITLYYRACLGKPLRLLTTTPKKVTNKDQATSKMSPASSGYLSGSLFGPEGGGSMFLQNIGELLPAYVTSQRIIFFTVTPVRTSNLT